MVLGGAHGRSEGGQGVTEMATGRLEADRRAQLVQVPDRRDPQPLCVPADAAQPAPDGARRHAQLLRDPAVTVPTQPSRPANAVATTSTPCPRRGTHQLGSSTWVCRHVVQRVRRGVRRTRRPSSSDTTRARAYAHGASRPAAHDGHASRRPARSASARSGSR